MKTVVEVIQFRINSLEKSIAENKSKLEADFLYSFGWGYANEIYSEMYIKQVLTNILRELQSDDRVQESKTVDIESWTAIVLGYYSKSLTEELLRGGYAGTSSGVSHNVAHGLEKEAKCKILELVTILLKKDF